ncbi:hypothetical protein ACFX12_005760 [Malus domestica]
MDFELASPLCFLLLLLLLPFFTAAQTDQTKNISLGSTLTALHNKSFWASPSGDFAFGFQEIGKHGFLLAIWFNKIPERTIVWSANGDTLVSKGSAVELTADGRFMLNDVATGKQISVADFVGTGVSYAAMLDTGNFILANRNSTILWQSFDQPTDTILPLQILNQKGIIFARYTPTNYSKGRFRFALQSNGQLLLYTTHFPLDSANTTIYWSTDTKDSCFQVIYNMSGSIYLTARNRSILHMISSNTVSFQDFYQRATLDYDGVLRHYVYPKSAGTSAAGGNHGLDYYIDPDDVLKGCKKDFVSQSCDAASPETDQFHFQEMQNTDWPESEYEKNGQCWLKGSPLLNGRVDPINGVKGLVKIRKDNSTLRSGDRYMKKKDNSTLIMVGTVLLSSSGFLNLLLLLTTYFLVSRFYYGKAKVGQPHQITNLKNFTHKELEEATNGFKEELGRGAFATVFKGVLGSDEGKCVAVKRLNVMIEEFDLEFKVELSAISRTNHWDLVELLGFCNEREHQILVYEFMRNNSLASFIFEKSRPNWNRRKEIAFGITRGLLYLREECSTQIIHCDIKPQNILLDDCYTARISDLGLAKLFKVNQTQTTTRIRGTRGYVSPEWFKNMPITAKVDVYSYGIMLLEIICCRRNFDKEAKDEDQMVLADWACDCYKQIKLHLLFQNDDEAMGDIKNMEKYVMIAMWCIQEDPSLRPTTKKLTMMLKGAKQVSVPTYPSPITSSNQSILSSSTY